ncbi:MAG: tetratricopeptide repeat protein, partial [Anaerolineae bacterium]|nr:tetratricopeptide repeat protein [Anaerolineae bacterium]
HEQALAIARETQSRPLEANQLGNLGTVYRLLGRVGRAMEHHEQALAVARELEDLQMEGQSLGSLGNCYLAQANHKQATEYY